MVGQTVLAYVLSMRIQDLRDTLDFPDIARFLKPRPMLFISGRDDRLFPSRQTALAFRKMHYIYESGASRPGKTSLITEIVPEGHHCGKAVQKKHIRSSERSCNRHKKTLDSHIY